MFRFLFNRDRFAFMIEFYNTESLRIVYIISENSSAFSGFCILYCCFQSLFQTMSCKNIIAKNHSNGIVSDKLLTNDKCLCKSVRAWLYSVGKVNTKLMSVTQKLLKTRGILRSGDDQDVTDPCVHQYRHWIVDHWFIIDG